MTRVVYTRGTPTQESHAPECSSPKSAGCPSSSRLRVPMKTRRSILKVEIKSQGQVMTNDLDVQDLPTHFHGHSRILVLYY